MTDAVKVLSNDEFPRVWANNKIGELIISPEIDALCATVRALRAELACYCRCHVRVTVRQQSCIHCDPY